MINLTPAEATKAGIAVGGAAVSLSFMKGIPWAQKLTMFAGSVFVSYVFATPVAVYTGLDKLAGGEGGVGGLLAIFGMSLIYKGFEFINNVDVKIVFMSIVDRIKGK